MKNVVITGSTRGIGLGMAREFLRRGHQVTISGRSGATTEKAVQSLTTEFGQERILGQPCDVSQFEGVQELWQAALNRFGNVDIWINNAGLSNPAMNAWDMPTKTIRDLVDTNLLGTIYGSNVAMQGMLKQGFGQIYNMEGFGSDGKMISPGLILYGATKSALTYYTKGLVREAKDTPVQVCWLSPGMVVTDLLIGDLDPNNDRTKRVFNILADRVETVAPYLVKQILLNRQHGARIAWLTTPKIAWRFMTAPFVRRDVLSGS